MLLLFVSTIKEENVGMCIFVTLKSNVLYTNDAKIAKVELVSVGEVEKLNRN